MVAGGRVRENHDARWRARTMAWTSSSGASAGGGASGGAVAVQVCDAPGALGQVPLKYDPLVGRQIAEQVFVQKLGEFAAVHTSPSRK